MGTGTEYNYIDHGLRILPTHCEQPVPVRLSSLTASVVSGGVALAWHTSSERRHAGFHVYRRDGESEDFLLMNSELIVGGPDYTFNDVSATPGSRYEYVLESVSSDGARERLGSVGIAVPIGGALALKAHPNPAVGSTTLEFAQPAPGRVRIRIVGVSGRLVRDLIDENRLAGSYVESWDLKEAGGSRVRAGVYFAQIVAGSEKKVVRVVVLP